MDEIGTLLDRDPNTEIIAVRHEQNPAPGYHLGIWIDFDQGGVRHALLMAIKANGAPRFACSTVYRLESCIAHLHRSEGQDVTRQSASCSMPPSRRRQEPGISASTALAMRAILLASATAISIRGLHASIPRACGLHGLQLSDQWAASRQRA